MAPRGLCLVYYKIKNIKSYRGEDITKKRRNWIGLIVQINLLVVGDSAEFTEVEKIGNSYTRTDYWITTSPVIRFKEVKNGYLIATFTGSVYFLEKVTD